jgi:hypothetical protein
VVECRLWLGVREDALNWLRGNMGAVRSRRLVTLIVVALLGAACTSGAAVSTTSPVTSTTVPSHPPPTIAVDLSATPAGWVPVAYGDAQVSVPASFSVYYPGQNPCELFSTPGALFVAPTPTTMFCPGHPHATFVWLVPTRQVPAVYAGEKPSIHNGVPVYLGPNGLSFVTHYAPTLGVDLTAQGPMARRVIDALTRSPRSVTLASGPAPLVPSGWHDVTFQGLTFDAPASWPVTPTTEAGQDLAYECGPSGVVLVKTEVTLSADQYEFPPGGCLPPAMRPQQPKNGVEVDEQGAAHLPVVMTFSKRCLHLHGLTACPATSPAYSILILKVAVPGRATPVVVSIGLAGNGLVARTVLDSLRAA